MEKQFEIEIWPNAGKMKKVYMTMIVATVLAWVAHITGTIFWEEHTHWVTNLRGITYEAGWPVPLYWWGMYLGIALPIFLPIIYLMNDTKNPSLAVSREGLFINQQMIAKTNVAWANVNRIEKSTDGSKVKLDIYFNDAQKIVDAQTGMKKAFVKENLKDNKPLSIENRFSTGDLSALADKANDYLSKN